MYINDLPVNTKYSITETEVAGYLPDVTTAGDEAVTIISRNSVSGIVTSKSTEILDGTDKTQTTIGFTNKILDTGTLEVNKVVEGTPLASAQTQFDFTLELEFVNDTHYIMPTLAVVTSANGTTTHNFTWDELGKATISFKMSDGDSFVIENLPVGTKYTIKEKTASNFTASVDGATGTINGEECILVNEELLTGDKTVDVTNTYTPPEITTSESESTPEPTTPSETTSDVPDSTPEPTTPSETTSDVPNSTPKPDTPDESTDSDTSLTPPETSVPTETTGTDTPPTDSPNTGYSDQDMLFKLALLSLTGATIVLLWINIYHRRKTHK